MPGSLEAGSNICRARPSGMKVGLTLSVVILASLIPLEHWPAHGFLLAVVFIGLSLAEVPIAYLFRRLALFLPMLLVFGLAVPITQVDKTAAWEWMIVRCGFTMYRGIPGGTVVDSCSAVSRIAGHTFAMALSGASGRHAGLHVSVYLHPVG